MYVSNMEPEMVLPPGSESFNHNTTRTTSSRSRSNNVNNNTVCVYTIFDKRLKDADPIREIDLQKKTIKS